MQLPTAAEAHTFHQSQLRAAAHAAATEGLPTPLPAQHPNSANRGSAGGAMRRDPHHRFDGELPNAQPRSYRSPVGGSDHIQVSSSMSPYANLPMLTHLVCHHTLTYHIQANLSTSEGVNAQARLAFNMTHGSGLSAVERDVAMLAAANDAVDESGGIRAFFKRWDHNGDRTLVSLFYFP